MIPMRKWSDYQAHMNPHLQYPGMTANRTASVSGLSAFNAPGNGTQYAGSVHGMPATRGSTYSLPMYPGEMPHRPMSNMTTNPYGASGMYATSMMGMPGYSVGFTPPAVPWTGGQRAHSPTGSFGGGSATGSDTGSPMVRPSTSQMSLSRPMSTFSQSPSMMLGNGLGLGTPSVSGMPNRQSTMSMFSNLNMPSVSDATDPSYVQITDTGINR